MTTEGLVARVQEHLREEQLLRAAHLLKGVPVDDRTPSQQQVIATAKDFETAIADLLEDPSADSSWRKQGESRGKRDTLIFYKVDEAARLTCRIETPIEASLLVPLLSVLNESSLYQTWMPSWSLPRMGIAASEQLEQQSRGRQLLRILADVPWPYSPREVLMQATAVDEIDARDFVAIRLSSDVPLGGFVLPPQPNVERIDFEGAILLRPCPLQHELLLKSRHVYREPLILLSFKLFVDPLMTGIPVSVINFVTRTVIGSIWAMFLQVAEGVRDGKRPEHQKAIAEKKDFYQWMETRIGILLQKATAVEPLVVASHVEDEENDMQAQKEFISYLQS
jgi:hypothetical protein